MCSLGVTASSLLHIDDAQVREERLDSTVDYQRAAGHVRRQIHRKEQRGTRDVGGFTDAAERGHRVRLFEPFGCHRYSGTRRQDRAGRDRICAHATRSEFHSERLHPGHERGLRSSIGRMHRRAGKTAHRRNEDHGSAVLDEHLAEFLRREVGVTQAEIKLAVPKLVGDLKDVGPRRDANDVDEAVKRSELLPSERREPNHLGTFCRVARPRNADSDFLGNFICTRQHREQFLGAHIKLFGSVVGVESGGVTFQLELLSMAPTMAEEQLASTHLLRLGLVDVQTRAGVALNDGLLQRARRQQCDVLETAQPRRLTSGPMRHVTYDEVAALDHEVWCDRLVQAFDCDPHGWSCAGPTDLAWGPRSVQRPSTVWQYQDTDGRAYGLANVEHRRVVLALPRLGAHLQTVAANVAVERNRRVRREWTFDLESGELHAMGEFVDLVVDLASRRAVEIPEGFRTALLRFLHPELAHD